MDNSKDKKGAGTGGASKKKGAGVHKAKAPKHPLQTLSPPPKGQLKHTPAPASGPSIGHLDLLEGDFDLALNPDALDLDGISSPAPLPTRLRPGTPSPSRTASPHVKQKIRQMSISAQDDLDGAKHTHAVTGSKSAPVPHRDHEVVGHHHDHTHSRAQKASPQPPHHHHHGNNEHVKFTEPETISLLDRQVKATIAMGLDLLPSPTPSLTAAGPSVNAQPPKVPPPVANKGPKARLAVVKGSVYVPSRTKAPPIYNTFIETTELGPPGAERRWLVDMKGFREDEITFTLNGVNLKIDGKQSSRPGKEKHRSETISIPINYDIESLKVYHNKTIGTLVLAYMPENYNNDIVK